MPIVVVLPEQSFDEPPHPVAAPLDVPHYSQGIGRPCSLRTGPDHERQFVSRQLRCLLALSTSVLVGIMLTPPTVASAGVATAAGAATSTSGSVAAQASASTPVPGSFRGLSPTRVLDTRLNLGAGGPVAASQSIAVQVLGAGGVPLSGVAAVTMSVTVTGPTATGYIATYADGAARPDGSNLNFKPGQIVSNLVVVPVGSDGKIRLANGSDRGSVQLVGDVTGYYFAGQPAAAGTFQALSLRRVLDTRTGLGAAGPLPGQASTAVKMSGVGGIPATGVSAVVVNMTVTAPAAGGYIAASASGSTPQGISHVNFVSGQTVANLVVVPLGGDGKISVFNKSGGPTQLVADVVGYYLSGSAAAAGTFRVVPATRLLDTRSGLGAVAAPLPAGASMSFTVSGKGGVPSSGAAVVMLNITIVESAAQGYLTVYPDGGSKPTGSNLAFATRQTVANLVAVPVGLGGRVRISNTSGGAVNLLADVAGVYLGGSGAAGCNSVQSDPSGTLITRWNPITLCILSALGQSAGNLDDVNTMIQYESSGDPNAINLWDSNAQQGHPSEGLIQVIRPTFDQYRTLLLPDDLFNPAANLYAGLNYAIHTYGSIHNVPGLVSLRNGGGYVGYIVQR